MFSKHCEGALGCAAMPGRPGRRLLKPGERIVSGRLFYSAAWLGPTAPAGHSPVEGGAAPPLGRLLVG